MNEADEEWRDDSGSPLLHGGMPWDGVERRSGLKRRKRRRYRFIDRRSGFDRRKRYPVLGTIRDHPWLLVLALVLLNLLSLTDGALTVLELDLGIAKEGNPILLAAGDRSWMYAVGLKVGGMALATAIFWIERKRRFVLGLALVTLGLFAGIVAYHLGSLRGFGWL